ncbi:MAG: ferritin [Peptococcaceae bacterium]|nr:ferritin [Peptococcaceae bacterium]MDR2736895.1 ferritin [Gracilibacteraceae bacterium]
MIKNTLTKAFSDQVNKELYSSYLYLAMSAFAEQTGYKGIANWFFVQAQEEMAHGIHMYQYIVERGAAPAFGEIEAPPTTFEGIHDMFVKVLAHEQDVTESINTIATLAMKENDHACYNFIMWYVDEQIEEEAGVKDILAKLTNFGSDPGFLYNLDNELASRVFVHPFPNR